MYKLVVVDYKTRDILMEETTQYVETIFRKIYKYYHEIQENKVSINIVNERSLETIKINHANLAKYDGLIDLFYQDWWNE